MASPYAGANTFPSNITLPSDGDVGNASSVNVPMSALADRTYYLYVQGVAQGLVLGSARYVNWPMGVTTQVAMPPSTPGLYSAAAAYDRVFSRLFVAGGNGSTSPALVVVTDAEAPLVNLLSAFSGDSTWIRGVSTDINGNVVSSSLGRYAYLVSSALVASRVDVVGANVSYTDSAIDYNAFSNQWLLVSVLGSASVPASYRSTNRTTWTANTGPLSSAAYTRVDIGSRASNGEQLVAGLVGSTVRFNKTSNGGGSWGTETSITSLIASPTQVHVSWDPFNSLWVCVVSNNTNGSEVWYSSTGLSGWTKRVSLGTPLGKIAVDEFGVYVGCFYGQVGNGSAGPALSTDLGASWAKVGFAPAHAGQDGAPTKTLFTGLSFIAVAGIPNGYSQIMQSLKTGNPVYSAVT